MQISAKDKSPIISSLSKHKGSNTCILLGSGPSINNISDSHWERLKRHDLWTVNNWVYHPTVVPDFYHVETKWYGYEILKRRFDEKNILYRDCRFIFPWRKTITLKDETKHRLKDVVFDGASKYEYRMQKRDPKRTHKVFSANYNFHPRLITKSYDMSLTSVFEMIYRMGYQRIVTFGVDLNNSLYFWTNRPECGKVHHQTNKEHEGKNPDLPHATHRILHFILDFNSRHMKPHGREICCGHENSALSDYLRILRPEEL